MNLRSLLLILVLAAAAAFAALNWSAFNTPTTLSVGFDSITAPLGLIMLGFLAVVSVLFLTYIVYLQTSVLLEARRHARELQTHRTLADQAEASRFTELRKYVEGELQTRAARDAQLHEALLARIDRLDATVRTALNESNNTVAAHFGELEDRLARNDRRFHGDTGERRDH